MGTLAETLQEFLATQELHYQLEQMRESVAHLHAQKASDLKQQLASFASDGDDDEPVRYGRALTVDGFALQIYGDSLEVSRLVEPGAEPGEDEPSPSEGVQRRAGELFASLAVEPLWDVIRGCARSAALPNEHWDGPPEMLTELRTREGVIAEFRTPVLLDGMTREHRLHEPKVLDGMVCFGVDVKPIAEPVSRNALLAHYADHASQFIRTDGPFGCAACGGRFDHPVRFCPNCGAALYGKH